MVIKHSSKIFAVIISFVIIGLLIAMGPAQAYNLELKTDNTEVKSGGMIVFNAGLEIEGNEFLNLSSFALILNGPQTSDCEFNTDGSIIKGCDGMLIEPVSSAPYGYGYGYGYGFSNGKFEYKITLNSSRYLPGTYKTKLNAFLGNDVVEKDGADILIKPVISGLEGCSVRAENGKLSVESKEFSSPKISFYIPLGNPDNGKGSITGRNKDARFSYKFDIIEVLENKKNYADIRVSGDYKLEREKDKPATLIIHFDKIKNRISINDKTISLKDAEVNFRKNC
jgi:hypothetical protein